MIDLTLQNKIVKHIHYNFTFFGDEEVKLKSTFNISLKFADDRSSAIALYTQKLEEDSEAQRLLLEVSLESVFSCENINTDTDKRLAHIDAYKQLFPYMQVMIAQLVSMAGFPPLTIQQDKIVPENIIISPS